MAVRLRNLFDDHGGRQARFHRSTMNGSWWKIAALGAVASCTGAPAPPPPPQASTPAPSEQTAIPQDLFARVNGITLHYLDWGGSGDLLLFLPGWSGTAHVFDDIAPAFTDRYRVVGLTRRGHGSSEKTNPERGLETLVKDEVAFIDATGAKRVILAGHSFAGLEMPLVAEALGDRVAGVVFLDAVYDWPTLFAAPLPSAIGK